MRLTLKDFAQIIIIKYKYWRGDDVTTFILDEHLLFFRFDLGSIEEIVFFHHAHFNLFMYVLKSYSNGLTPGTTSGEITMEKTDI